MSKQERDKLVALTLPPQEEAFRERAQSPADTVHTEYNYSRADESGIPQAGQSGRSILLIAKGGSIIFIGTTFSYVMRFLFGILITRFLGPENFGLYTISLTVGMIGGGLAMLGLDFALVRFVSLFASRDDKAGLWGILQIGLGITTIAGLLVGVGIYALATPIAEHIFHDLRLVPLIRIASLISPLIALTNNLAAATRGFNKMQYDVIAREAVPSLLRLFLIGLMVLVGLSAAATLIIYIFGLVVALALLVYFLNFLFPLVRPVNSARRDTKDVLIYSLPAYFSNLIDTFGGNLQGILLGSLNSIATAGIFSVTSTVSMVSNTFNSSLGTASNPIISSLHGKGELAEMKRFYQITTKWMFTVNLLFFLIIVMFPGDILGIFGKDFAEGATALVILVSKNMVVAIVGITGGILNMTGHSSLRLVNSIVYSVLSIALSLLLIPHWGIIGAAIAVLISNLTVGLLRVIQVFLLFRILPFNMTFTKPIVAGLVAYSIGLFIRQSFQTEGHLIMIALNALVIFLAYVGVVFALGLSNEDRVVIDGFRNRLFVMFSKKRSGI